MAVFSWNIWYLIRCVYFGLINMNFWRSKYGFSDVRRNRKKYGANKWSIRCFFSHFQSVQRARWNIHRLSKGCSCVILSENIKWRIIANGIPLNGWHLTGLQFGLLLFCVWLRRQNKYVIYFISTLYRYQNQNTVKRPKSIFVNRTHATNNSLYDQWPIPSHFKRLRINHSQFASTGRNKHAQYAFTNAGALLYFLNFFKCHLFSFNFLTTTKYDCEQWALDSLHAIATL